VRFVSRPQEVEAVQWTGTAASFAEAVTDLPGKVRSRGLNDLSLLAGKDGAQEWVPVPIGHWLVHMPGDLTDVWPVDSDYFAAKYMPADTERHDALQHDDCAECGTSWGVDTGQTGDTP
jgi:hypothetical protein